MIPVSLLTSGQRHSPGVMTAAEVELAESAAQAAPAELVVPAETAALVAWAAQAVTVVPAV